MPKSKSRSRKLNSYQKSIKSHKKAIAELAEKKGLRFMATAALYLKRRKSMRKSGSKSRSRSSSRKSCPRGKVWRKTHKSASGKRIAGACVKKGGLKSRSKSRRSKSKSRKM